MNPYYRKKLKAMRKSLFERSGENSTTSCENPQTSFTTNVSCLTSTSLPTESTSKPAKRLNFSVVDTLLCSVENEVPKKKSSDSRSYGRSCSLDAGLGIGSLSRELLTNLERRSSSQLPQLLRTSPITTSVNLPADQLEASFAALSRQKLSCDESTSQNNLQTPLDALPSRFQLKLQQLLLNNSIVNRPDIINQSLTSLGTESGYSSASTSTLSSQTTIPVADCLPNTGLPIDFVQNVDLASTLWHTNPTLYNLLMTQQIATGWPQTPCLTALIAPPKLTNSLDSTFPTAFDPNLLTVPQTQNSIFNLSTLNACNVNPNNYVLSQLNPVAMPAANIFRNLNPAPLMTSFSNVAEVGVQRGNCDDQQDLRSNRLAEPKETVVSIPAAVPADNPQILIPYEISQPAFMQQLCPMSAVYPVYKFPFQLYPTSIPVQPIPTHASPVPSTRCYSRNSKPLYSETNLNEKQTCKWHNCNQEFHGTELFIEHVNEHVKNQTNNVCHWIECDRKYEPFSAHYMLVLHVRKHTGEKPNKCELCSKAYSRRENLNTHKRTHTGERPYKCDFAGCTRAFSNASDRAKHLNRTHSGQKPYACPVEQCDKAYADPSSLRKHIKTQHGDDIYEEAKENKARNGRGGNYGFIPISRLIGRNQFYEDEPSTSHTTTDRSQSSPEPSAVPLTSSSTSLDDLSHGQQSSTRTLDPVQQLQLLSAVTNNPGGADRLLVGTNYSTNQPNRTVTIPDKLQLQASFVHKFADFSIQKNIVEQELSGHSSWSITSANQLSNVALISVIQVYITTG